jgi:hypothetical protein
LGLVLPPLARGFAPGKSRTPLSRKAIAMSRTDTETDRSEHQHRPRAGVARGKVTEPTVKTSSTTGRASQPAATLWVIVVIGGG